MLDALSTLPAVGMREKSIAEHVVDIASTIPAQLNYILWAPGRE